MQRLGLITSSHQTISKAHLHPFQQSSTAGISCNQRKRGLCDDPRNGMPDDTCSINQGDMG